MPFKLLLNTIPVKFVLVILCGLMAFPSIGQPKNEISEEDSLRTRLQTEKDINEKLELYQSITRVFFFQGNPDSTIHYAIMGEDLAQKVNNELIYAKLLYYHTVIQNNISRQDALENYNKVEEIFTRLGTGTMQLNVSNRLLELHANFGNYEKVKKYAEISSNIIDSINVEPKKLLSMKANFYQIWGYANTRLQNFENTILNFKKAKQYYGELENDFEVAKANFNISVEFIKKNELDSAAFYMSLAKKYFDSVDHDFGKAMVNSELGALYIKKNEISKGIDLLNKAVDICKRIKLNQPLDATYSHLGVAYGKLKDYDKAIFYEKESLKLSELLKDTASLILSNELISGYYEEVGDYRNAFNHQKEFIALNESKLEIENKQMLEEVEAKYQVKEKESQIQLQNIQLTQQRNNNIAIGIVAGLLLLLALLIWRTARQRKQTNNQLKRLDNAKSRFFANISHELRTPLTLILAPLENAIEKARSKSIKSDLQLAHSNSKKLFSLVNEIMDLSKLESGKMQLKETAVDLEKFLRRILFSYQSLAQVREFSLGFSYHLPEGLVVKLDIGKFEKVLNNLLSNAFKYSKPGGVITLRAGKENGLLKFEVQDTGRGIPPEQLEKIFERFYQVEDEGEPLQGGTGIGLAYAKEIAHLFSGDLRVESKLSKGSNFILTMPLKKTVLKKAMSTDSEEIHNSDYSKIETALFSITNDKPRILIVEDNPEMSKFLVQTLSGQFQCTTAIDGMEALNKLENQKFDLITSDVMMPNMDGFAFLEKVHEREDFLTTPVIMLTARTLEEDKLRGFQLGVDDYLTKPFSTKELIARINNLLRNKAEREQWHVENKSKNSVNKEEEKPLSFEKKLLKTAEDLVLDNLSNSKFKITELARELNYSQRQLERIMKKLTGLSPVGFVREIRLQKAYQMIESRQFATISEVRFEVGMENASHFTKKFQERFGKSPNEV